MNYFSSAASLGWGTGPKKSESNTKEERKDFVIFEVVKMQKESYKFRAGSQQQQGKWKT